VYLGYTEEQEALREELVAYYDKLLTPEVQEALHLEHGVGPVTSDIMRQMGADGWYGIGWPEQYGGQGRSQLEQFVFFNESMRMGAPVPMLTINTVAPSIMAFGSDEMKQEFLPRMLSGEIQFCIGYSEPEAGTDLAALRTKGVKDGDEYVVNGQKMWTSLASGVHYCWLAVRTDPDAPKHKGISIMVVDMDDPGITVDPLHLLSTHDINAVFYDDVRVPASRLVGEENKGWNYITNQLNHERITIAAPGLLQPAYDDVVAWAAATRDGSGRRVIDQEWVQVNLARVHAGLEFLRLANWKTAWDATNGNMDVALASTIKVFGTEWFLESFRLLMEIVGPRAYLERNSVDDQVAGRLEMLYRSLIILTFGGGTNEIQRDLIGMFGMSLPRTLRG
jgi:alkylation response protein AidB-like acyl-CoA dehydrogenase